MAALGLDTDSLARLSVELDRSHAHLELIGAATGRRLRSAGWHGPDGDRFAREWDMVHRPTIERAARFCRTLAREIDRHIAQQVEVSAAATVPAHLFATAGPPSLPPSPRDVVMLSGQADVSVLSVMATRALSVEVTDADRDRQQVSVTDLRGAGLSTGASAGGRVRLGDHHAGIRASVGASAELDHATRSEFTIDDGDLPVLVAGLVGDVALTTTGPVGQGIRAGGWVAEQVLDRLGIDSPVDSTPTVPEPDRTEHLVGGTVRASASVTAGATHDEITGEVSILVQVPESESGSQRVELRAEAGAVLGSALSPLLGGTLVEQSGSIRAELELVRNRSGELTDLHADIATVTDDRAEMLSAHLDLRDPGMRANRGAVERAIQRLTAGDLDGAAAELGSIRTTAESVAVRRTEGTVTTTPFEMNVGATVEGIGLSGAFSGRSTEIDWAPRQRR